MSRKSNDALNRRKKKTKTKEQRPIPKLFISEKKLSHFVCANWLNCWFIASIRKTLVKYQYYKFTAQQMPFWIDWNMSLQLQIRYWSLRYRWWRRCTREARSRAFISIQIQALVRSSHSSIHKLKTMERRRCFNSITPLTVGR